VGRLLKEVSNLKHKIILMTIYSSGLRLSEALHLSWRDIDSERMLIHVRHAKGKQERIIPLSPTLLHGFRQYRRLQDPGRWLFPGKDPDYPISGRWVQRFTNLAGVRANLSKRATPRSLRHSFATHHLEAGTDIRIIQELLGHANLTSTLVYVHVSRKHLMSVASPLEQLHVDIAPAQLTLDGF
jgi:site-specific recombinase XerD